IILSSGNTEDSAHLGYLVVMAFLVNVIKDLLKMLNLLTFMDFPPAIRQSLYSTNLIENFNKHLKRTTHHKEQFPTEDSLDRFLVS
ncbi:transposase, partial [Lactiplantibacillus pentosus]|uniref:transposase n=1 Tax=Lactiplantibacillus pentosus TaxID=1589 RepID=UPI001CDB2EB5